MGVASASTPGLAVGTCVTLSGSIVPKMAGARLGGLCAWFAAVEAATYPKGKANPAARTRPVDPAECVIPRSPVLQPATITPFAGGSVFARGALVLALHRRPHNNAATGHGDAAGRRGCVKKTQIILELF
jgi:hypothetical protein